ncbi:hypothetical protein DL765_010776 [Monosporascus sp. GIB2]|nr:hypothetical protein DL765_010776 [Monosporascus sp. GIB2]
MWPIIQYSSANLSIGCQKVKDVCDRTLDLASTAKQDNGHHSGPEHGGPGGPSLSNLEVLLGAVGAITSDLRGLRQSIRESAQPGPGVLLDVEEKVLELWDRLKTEVQNFKDHYAI